MFKTNEIRDIGRLEEPRGKVARGAPGADIRFRLRRLGPKLLAPGEILALVIGAGGPVPAAVAAAEMLERHGGLAGVAALDLRSIGRERGLGPVRTSRLAAALELASRLRAPGRREGVEVKRPADVMPLLYEEFRGCDREHFLALQLDSRHRVTAVDTVSIGCLNASIVHPREVFRDAVAAGAAAVLVAHNHPSGCAEPSRDDIDLTARLAGCGRLLGIELLDHLIVGDGEFTSLREHGWPGQEWG